jgi:peptidoglycan/LPS O-acetylase OafA/YrhL
MRSIGALSYCVYLVHFSIGDFYEPLMQSLGLAPNFAGPMGSILLRGVMMIVLSFGFAMFSQRFIEDPFLRLKDRFAGSPKREGARTLAQTSHSS